MGWPSKDSYEESPQANIIQSEKQILHDLNSSKVPGIPKIVDAGEKIF